MNIQTASISLLVNLLSLVVSYSRAASSEDAFFSITKTVSDTQTTNVDVIGRGIADTFTFTPTEDKTVYNNNKQLLIGDKIYTDKKNSVYVITDRKCVQRDYVSGRMAYEMKVDLWRCNTILAKMAEAKKTLFGDDDSNNYHSPYFTTATKRDSIGRTTVEVRGKGVLDQFTLSVGENTDILNNGVVVIGNTIYSGGHNSVIVVEEGICTERKYSNGRISEANILPGSKCREVISNIQDAKKASRNGLSFGNNDEFSVAKDDSKATLKNENTKYDLPYFTTALVDGAQVMQVFGNGIKDEITFLPHEDVSVYKTDDTLVIGDRVFTDKPNSLTVIQDGRCHERVYREGLNVFTHGRHLEDCKEVLRGMQIAKNNVVTSSKNSQENKLYTVTKEEISQDQVLVEVSGNGVHDTFQIPAKQEVIVCDDDNVLIIGDWLYTDRPNSLMVVENGNCKEIVYEKGKKKEVTTLDPSQCNNLKMTIAMAKSPLQDDEFLATSNRSNKDEDDNFNSKSSIEDNNIGPIKGTSGNSSPYFTVNKIHSGKQHMTMEVVGYGVEDHLTFPIGENPFVYNKGNTLIVGDRFYTNKPSSLTELSGGQCTERSYVDGKRKRGHIILTKRQCDEITEKIARVKSSLSSEDPLGKNRPDSNSGAAEVNDTLLQSNDVNVLVGFLKSLPQWLQGALNNFYNQKKSS